MYGIEAATGTGGLMAQLPFADRYLPGAIASRGPGPLTGGPWDVASPGFAGNNLPYSMPINDSVSLPPRQAPPGARKQGWQEIFDWHNSPAIWILLAILILYGWIHVGVKASGRASVG